MDRESIYQFIIVIVLGLKIWLGVEIIVFALGPSLGFLLPGWCVFVSF